MSNNVTTASERRAELDLTVLLMCVVLGPLLTQPGTLFRQLWLDVNEMNSVAIGMNEEMIQEARKLDEFALPEEEVGLYCVLREVWAVKGGGADERSLS